MSDDEQAKQDEQEKYRSLQYRMYENEFPQKNEVVYVRYVNIYNFEIYSAE